MSEQALSHLKVVELCNLVSGPYCTKLMADLGAEVLKIEPPGIGDQARTKGPFVGDKVNPELSGLFLHLNTSKLGITLDVTTATGREILEKLLVQADIFVEDTPPGIAEKQRLTYKYVEELNPRLVMTSITPFGKTGPYRDYKAYELNLHHAGGEGFLLPIQSSEPDREPVKVSDIVGDSICGLTACLATLTAAYFATATGIGQHVDVSKQDVLMTLVQNHVCTYANLGEVHDRLRKGFLTVLPMACKDGYIMMTIVSDSEWQSLVRCMGNPEWAQDERFASWAGRHWWAETEINPRVREWVSQYTKDELFHRLQAAGVAAVPVMTSEDLAKSPQLNERGFFAEIEHTVAGTLRYPTVSYQFSKTPWRGSPAPLLGQHNEPIYCERLGYSRRELTQLATAGII
jgi:CoA:oxalate CoA-transferase